MSLLQKGWNRFAGFFGKVWARIKGMFGETDADAEITKINDEIVKQDQQINDQQNQTIAERDTQRKKRLDQIEQDRLGAQSALDPGEAAPWKER